MLALLEACLDLADFLDWSGRADGVAGFVTAEPARSSEPIQRRAWWPATANPRYHGPRIQIFPSPTQAPST